MTDHRYGYCSYIITTTDSMFVVPYRLLHYTQSRPYINWNTIHISMLLRYRFIISVPHRSDDYFEINRYYILQNHIQ